MLTQITHLKEKREDRGKGERVKECSYSGCGCLSFVSPWPSHGLLYLDKNKRQSTTTVCLTLETYSVITAVACRM